MLVRPVILCGGSGTRLWPLSRSLYPKQFMDLGGRTLFGETVIRAMAVSGAASPLVVCNETQRFFAAAILRDMNIQGSIILEPQARNTAPAIALAACIARSGGNDPLLLVLPSDHSITPLEAFTTSVETAFAAATEGYLTTFGVVPLGPETGFGYIHRGEALPELPGIFRVARFVEKPSKEVAEAMLATGEYFWNSGMFLFRASAYLEELAKYAPAVLEACSKACECCEQDGDFIRPAPSLFNKAPVISIDYAVMEQTHRAAVASLAAQWNDLGSWETFHTTGKGDADGNVCTGDVLVTECHDSYLHSTHRLVAALGVENMIVVETGDAILVAPRSRSQEVKKIVEKLGEEHRTEKDTHARVFRPWGSYEVLQRGERFQVKRIIVNPGSELSLQLHHHRAEHWVIVAGTAKVTVGDTVRLLHENQSTYIEMGIVHRLENPGRIPLMIIEIQTGSYLGEDDIVRLEDNYGRV